MPVCVNLWISLQEYVTQLTWWRGKYALQTFRMAMDQILAVCMIVQEVTDMLFHLELSLGSPSTEISLVMGPLVLLIS